MVRYSRKSRKRVSSRISGQPDIPVRSLPIGTQRMGTNGKMWAVATGGAPKHWAKIRSKPLKSQSLKLLSKSKRKAPLKSRSLQVSSKSKRKAPLESATRFRIGTIRKGNDGNDWIIIRTTSNVNRWQRL